MRKAHNLLWACRRACGAAWGLRPKMVHWLYGYVAIVRPTVSFASLIWWPGCQTASAKKKLSKVQRLACLGIAGAIRTTPTGAMKALVGLPALDLVIQGEARSVAHRLWSLQCCGTPAVKWLVWFMDGSRTAEETGAAVYGRSAKEGSVSL